MNSTPSSSAVHTDAVEIECAVFKVAPGHLGSGLRVAIASRAGRHPVRSLPVVPGAQGPIGWVSNDGMREELRLPPSHPDRDAVVQEVSGPGLVVADLVDVRDIVEAIIADRQAPIPVSYWILWSEAPAAPVWVEAKVISEQFV